MKLNVSAVCFLYYLVNIILWLFSAIYLEVTTT